MPDTDKYPLWPGHMIYMYNKYITRNRYAIVTIVATCNNV